MKSLTALVFFTLILALTLPEAGCHRRAAAGDPEADAIPIACRLGVFTAAERERQQELREAVSKAAVGVDEEPDGYRLRFRDDPAVLAQIAEWIPLERRCCPFLAFDVDWPAGKAGPSLHLGGRPGVKEFLAAEMK
jgi:hypothetical protein